jgi:peroxiredoxin
MVKPVLSYENMVLLESLQLKLGSSAHNFSLKGIDGKMHALDDYRSAKVLVIIFMCNHCPYVQAVWERLNILQKKYEIKRVQLIGINPNLNPDYPDESFEKMKEYAEKFHMNFPYLQDTTQEVAKKYEAKCTPDLYVYDEKRELAYHGRLDNNWKEPEKVTHHELEEAIQLILQGKIPSEHQHPSMGCSIKWRQ